MKSVVLGAGGFIGGHLVNSLLKKGNDVVAVDVKPPYKWFQKFDEAHNYHFDASTSRNTKLVSYNADELYNLAANMGGMGFIASHRVDCMESAHTTMAAFRAAHEADVGKIFYASSACFVGGTLILTDRGLLPIESIVIGDEVIAADGVWHPVTNIHSRLYRGPLTQVDPQGMPSFYCTPDHRLLSKDKTWIQASESTSLSVVYPKLDKQDNLFTFEKNKYNELWQEIGQSNLPLYKLALKHKININTPYKWNALKKKKKFPSRHIDPVNIDFVSKTFELGRLLGLIAAEGWYETHRKYNTERIVVAFGKHEIELINEYKLLLQTVLNIHPDRIIQYEANTAIKIHVTSKRFVSLVKAVMSCDQRAHNKLLTPFGMFGPECYIQGFISGHLAGDGCVSKNRIVHSTTSEILAHQIRYMLLSLGLNCSIQHREAHSTKIDGRVVNGRDSWHIYYRKTSGATVKTSLTSEVKCTVYNLEVLDDPSYCVDGFIAHNCIYNDKLQQETDVYLKEDDAWPADPEPGYGLEKLYGEQLGKFWNEEYGLNVRIARFHNCFGPYTSYQGGREKAPAAICRKVAEAKLTGSNEITIWGDGEQTRSFLYIDECLDGVSRLMESDYIEPLNIGSSELVSINQMVTIVENIADVKLKRNYDLAAPQGVRGRCSDNTRIQEVLGWQPTQRLEVGLEKTYQWIYDILSAKSGN